MAVRSKRIIAQILKELTQLGRDRLTLTMALGLPILLLLLYGFAISLQVNEIKLAFQDLSMTPTSREYIATFERAHTFKLVAQGPNLDLPHLLDQGQISGGIVIPPKFSRDLNRANRTATVQLLLDGSDSNTANVIRGYASATNSEFVQNAQSSSATTPVNFQSRLWYNPGLETLRFMGPGAIAMTVTLFPPLLAGLATAKEREQGTILQVYASSLTGTEYLLGKAGAFWLVGMAEILIVSLESWLCFGLRFAGDPTPVILGSVLYVAGGVFWGIFLGASTNSQSTVIQNVSFTAFLLSLQLSGFIYPISNIPSAIRWVSLLIPARHYIVLTRNAYARGSGWVSDWSPLLGLLLLAILFFFLAWRKLQTMQVEA
jgi:ABC-2 type transport system permease protein